MEWWEVLLIVIGTIIALLFIMFWLIPLLIFRDMANNVKVNNVDNRNKTIVHNPDGSITYI